MANPPFLLGLRYSYPHYSNLRDGITDIAIDWLPVALDPFVNKKLFNDEMMLLARSGHPSVNERVTIENLRETEFVTLERQGDQIENDYEKEVYNGDIGYVDEADREDGELVASFDDRAVVYAFGELDTLSAWGNQN